MPCRDYEAETQADIKNLTEKVKVLKDKLDVRSAMLCEVMNMLESEGETRIVQGLRAGVIGLGPWWDDHKEEDRKRREEEAKKTAELVAAKMAKQKAKEEKAQKHRRRNEVRNALIARMTEEEKDAMGIK